MPARKCPKCGRPMKGDQCAACEAATHIAKPEHAEQAKVTPPSDDGAIREGEPPVEPSPVEPWPYKHEPGPGCGYSWVGFIVATVLGVTALGILMIPICTRLNDAVYRGTTNNNMKQIALACHGYHDVHKGLPPPRTVIGKDGVEREVDLSWRVAILPYMDHAALEKEFGLTVAWDDQKNAPLANKMPVTFTCPYRTERQPSRMTYYQYFTGPATLFPDNVRRKLIDIPDGSSRTILFAEAAETVVWTQPADMRIIATAPLPVPADGFYVALADGTVRFIVRKNTSDTVLRQLIDPNDGKPKDAWE